jgi:hypothetical protein
LNSEIGVPVRSGSLDGPMTEKGPLDRILIFVYNFMSPRICSPYTI